MFDFTVSLSGLLHYVENLDPARDVRLCIVLPSAPNHKAVFRTAGGGRITLNGATQASEEFSGKRVIFQFTQSTQLEAEERPEFDFEGPVIEGSVKGAVPLERMIGDRADKNLDIVSPSSFSKNDVRAQVLVDKEARFSLANASFLDPQIQLPNGEILSMAPSVLMELRNLTSAQIVVMPLDASSTEAPRIFRIEPEGDGPVRLELSHFCPPRRDFEQFDEDFRFHYSLLSRSSNLRAPFAEALPVPRIVRFLDDLGDSPEPRRSTERSATLSLDFDLAASPFLDFSRTGCNCAPARGLGRPFDLDAFRGRQDV